MTPLVFLELDLNAQPPRSRARVFANTVEFDFDRSMVLGVWGNHTRLLLPEAETAPEVWRRWQNIADAVVIKDWGGWKSTNIPDSTRVHVSLEPCVTCLRNIRVPANEPALYSGVSENLRRRRNPYSHTTNPTASNTSESRAGFPEVDSDDTSYLGRGLLS